jgi:hypothetical protein
MNPAIAKKIARATTYTITATIKPFFAFLGSSLFSASHIITPATAIIGYVTESEMRPFSSFVLTKLPAVNPKGS